MVLCNHSAYIRERRSKVAEVWPIGAKVLELKGDMSYRELSDAIFAKTGKRLSFVALRQLANNKRAGRKESISILAEYAGKPISWFYETPPVSLPENVAEATIKYLEDVEDPHEAKRRRELLDMYTATGRKLSTPALEALLSLAKMVATDDKKGGDKH
jgi:hypothetical protein